MLRAIGLRLLWAIFSVFTRKILQSIYTFKLSTANSYRHVTTPTLCELILFARLALISVQGAHPNPAPTIDIGTDGGEPVLLPYVALGTGSGQKGDVANAVSLWLDKTAGVAIDTAYDCKSFFSFICALYMCAHGFHFPRG